jgi:class 3 adenylate cyclase
MAARLCNKAEANQVIVSNIVKELCMGKHIKFNDLGQTELKGFSLPVMIYEVHYA